MKIRALIDYKDKQLNKQIKSGEVYEVTEKRGKEIINAKYKGQAYAEEVKDTKAQKEKSEAKKSLTQNIKDKLMLKK